jgi:hypothetical protein
MGYIGLILLIFCVALAGLLYLSNKYTRYWIKTLLVKKMEWLDFVQETALVPADWRIRHEKALEKLPPADERKLRRCKEKARKDYFKRMEKLIHFAKICTLVSSDAERAGIIKNLESIRREWRESDDALFTPTQQPDKPFNK